MLLCPSPAGFTALTCMDIGHDMSGRILNIAMLVSGPLVVKFVVSPVCKSVT